MRCKAYEAMRTSLIINTYKATLIPVIVMASRLVTPLWHLCGSPSIQGPGPGGVVKPELHTSGDPLQASVLCLSPRDFSSERDQENICSKYSN